MTSEDAAARREHAGPGPGPRPRPGPRPGRSRSRGRGRGEVIFSAAIAVAGIGALALGVAALFAPESGVSEILRWTALAVLLLGAAAHRWWFAGRAEERSRRIAAELGPADVAEAERESSGEIQTIRRMRVAHPGLGLRDARDLVVRHRGQRTGDRG